MTRKYTIELSDITVIGCGLLLMKQGNDPTTISQEELIASTLGSMVQWFDRRGWIQLPDESAAEQEFAKMFLKNVAQVREHAESDFHIDLFEAGQRVEDAVASARTDKVVETTKRSTEPASVPDVQKPGKTNLSKVNRMDVDMLVKLAPKDVLIEKVVKGSVDQVYRYALEIVYTSLPPELWGSPTAEQAINDMILRHDGAL